MHGLAVEQDVLHGISLLTTAARKGSLKATNHLGKCFRDGIGTAKNMLKAAKLFKITADRDDPEGQLLYGTHLLACTIIVLCDRPM
jgi:TPR repeat protein